MVLYYVLTFTWGILMNIIGVFATMVTSACGGYVYIKHGRVIVEIGKCWGGVTFGNFIIVDLTSDNSIIAHEIGHSIQNAFMGPFFPFLVGIPSVVRYWYREFLWRKHRDRWRRLPDYDAIWFEHDATVRGEAFVKSREEK